MHIGKIFNAVLFGAVICTPALAASNPSTFAASPSIQQQTPYPILYVITPQMFGAKGDGATNDSAAFNTANGSTASNGSLTIGGGTFVIGSNLTLSHAVSFLVGGILKPSSGVTVTFTGPVNAGMYQICDVTAGGHCDFTLAQPSSGKSYVEWWGVVGGDSAYNSGHASTNTTLMVDAIAYTSPNLCFLNPKLYSIDSFTISGARGINVCGLGRNYTGAVPNGITGNGAPWPDAANMKTIVTPTGTLNSTVNVTAISNMADVHPGDLVSGTNIPANDYVVSTGSNSAVLAIAATGSATQTITFTKNDPARYLKYIIQNGEYLNGAEVVLDNLQVICNDMINCGGVAELQSTQINTLPWFTFKGGSYQGYIGCHISKTYHEILDDLNCYGNGLSVNTNHFWSGSGGQAMAFTAPNIQEPDGQTPAIVRLEINHAVPGSTGSVSGGLLFEDQAGACGTTCINSIHWTQPNFVGPAYDGMTLNANMQQFDSAEAEQFTNTVLTGEVGTSLWNSPYISTSTELHTFCQNLGSVSTIHYRDQIITGGAANCLPSIYLGTADAFTSGFQTTQSVSHNACAGMQALTGGNATVTSACFVTTSIVTCTDKTAANAVACNAGSGSLAITGTGTDVISWAVQ